MRALIEELGMTRDEVGRRVGRSRVAVSNLLRLLDLPDEALDLLAGGVLSEGHGRALLMARDHDERGRLARAAPPRGGRCAGRDEAAARRAPTPATGAPRPRGAPTPTRRPPRPARRRVRPRARGRRGGHAPRTGYRVALAFESLDEALELAVAAGRRRGGLTALSSPVAGRLAQSVRALL